MEYRQFGNTGLKVSVIGFGCGDIGGLIVRGEVQERTEVIRRALEIGITYFDTAALYGRGQSEINLGAALRQLKANPILGTKVRLQPEDLSNIKNGVVRSVENSLARPCQFQFPIPRGDLARRFRLAKSPREIASFREAIRRGDFASQN